MVGLAGTKTDDDALKCVASSCGALQWAGLTQTQITGSSISALMRGCPRLLTLNGLGCDLKAPNELTAPDFMAAQSLQRFNVAWCSLELDEMVSLASEFCPNLVEVQLSGNIVRHQPAFFQALSKLKLEVLELRSSRG